MAPGPAIGHRADAAEPRVRPSPGLGSPDDLDIGFRRAAPLRLAALDLPVPFAPELEAAFRPDAARVIDRITAWMG